MENRFNLIDEPWISRMLIDHTKHEDHCPLCGQDYDPETLQERISSLESSVRGGASIALELEIENDRSAFERQGRLLREIRSLKLFAQNAGMSDGTVSSVLGYYRLTVLENTRLVAEQERLAKLARDAEASGFSVNGLLRALGMESVPETVEQKEFDSLLTDTQRMITELPAYIGDVRARAVDATNKISLICSKYGLKADPVKSVGVALEEKHQELRDVVREVEKVSEQTQIDTARPLGALESLVKAALVQALRVQEARSAEAASNSRVNALQETVARLKTAKDAAEIAVERLSAGLGVVTEILEKSSLAEATEAAMATVHDVADGVFSRIHTPSEYKINAAIESPLLRKGSEDLVDLSEVSSGQRAAYALSVFIAMNAEAQKSPKVMLLDDPIAHIDDLNALSFLDYLRDLVLKADRQVFFATADDRIAGLFAHKFGFLGKDFKTIELDR